MKPSLQQLTLTALLGLTLLHPAQAREYQAGTLVITDPYTRTTPPAAAVGGGFLSVTNNADTADRLTGGQVDFAETVEVHEMHMTDGVMKMRQLENGLEIPAGGRVELRPGGYHLMFIGLKEPLQAGAEHAGTLQFEKAGEVAVVFEVRDINAMQPPANNAPMNPAAMAADHLQAQPPASASGAATQAHPDTMNSNSQ
ncbi:MAG: copper chaperone PCu(A)C [Thiothrix sp.]|nr:copper chaperone PCu(A)C [Thiothrix sp.]